MRAQPQVLRDHRGVAGVGLGAGQHLALAPGLDRVRADRHDRVPGLEQQVDQPPVRAVRSPTGMSAGSPSLASRRISAAIPSAVCSTVNCDSDLPGGVEHAHRVDLGGPVDPDEEQRVRQRQETKSTPHDGSDDSARRPAPGWSLTGALRRISLLPVRGPARTGGGGVMQALEGRPPQAVTPAPAESQHEHRSGAHEKGWCPSVFRSRDWIRHILGRRLESNPGERFAYSDATSHLLSAVVADATGQSTLAFARAELFGPLGIATDDALELTVNHWPLTQAELKAFEQATVAWPRDPQGYHFGGGGLRLPARDLASSAICTSTAGVGTAPRWSRRLCHASTATVTQVRATTATSGGSPTITATTASAPGATAASSSRSSPSWTWSSSSPATPTKSATTPTTPYWATIVPAVAG